MASIPSNQSFSSFVTVLYIYCNDSWTDYCIGPELPLYSYDYHIIDVPEPFQAGD